MSLWGVMAATFHSSRRVILVIKSKLFGSNKRIDPLKPCIGDRVGNAAELLCSSNSTYYIKRNIVLSDRYVLYYRHSGEPIVLRNTDERWRA